MYKVEIAESAEADLAVAYDWYLETGSLAVAEAWKQAIRKHAESLETMPRRCPYAPEHFHHRSELRCIRCFSHLIIFTIKDDRVIVKRIRHAKQNILQPGTLNDQ